MFGKTVFAFGGAMMWYIGDWINFGERKFGEKYSQALYITEYKYGTLRNAAYVSGRYEIRDRHPNLSWRHHADAARFEPGDRETMLKMVESQQLGSVQFREWLHRQYPSMYKQLGEGSEKSFSTWWPKYAATLQKEFAENIEVRHVAQDAFDAGVKSVDKDSIT